MPRVSKSPLTTQQIEEISEHFTYLLASLTDRSDIEIFLSEFFTPEEKVMMAKRLMLFIMLTQNYPEESIRNLFHFSHETIRTYRHQLPLKTKEFHLLIQKLLKRQKTQEFLQKLENILHTITTLTQVKTNMKARSKIGSGELF